jgi:hypothetical protein
LYILMTTVILLHEKNMMFVKQLFTLDVCHLSSYSAVLTVNHEEHRDDNTFCVVYELSLHAVVHMMSGRSINMAT